MIDRAQIEAATKRYEERAIRHDRNETPIEEKRLLEIDPPQRVEEFLRRLCHLL